MAQRKNAEEQILKLKQERDWLKARVKEIGDGPPAMPDDSPADGGPQDA